MDIETIKKIDLSKMYQTYDKWPEIAEKQFNTNIELIDNSNPEHIVFAGMGGSGAIGDLFSSILSKTNIHVDIVKGYLLPKTTDKNSLVVCTSISGNTVETISVLDQAKEIGCKTISFSNGGIMENISKEKNIDHRKIPSFHSPRASFTSFVYSMLRILSPVLPINNSDIFESITNMKKLQKLIWSKNLSETNPALQIALWLPEIPVIYYPTGLESAAIRFKNSLQENSKMHVISEDVIEACHNGIVAWENNRKTKPIFVRGKEDYVKTQERWEILKDFFNKEGIDYKEIFSESGSILTKVINLIYLFDYVSIYKSILSKIDPTPVAAVNFIKENIQ